MHKLDGFTAHVLWRAYRRQTQRRRHGKLECDRTVNFLEGVGVEFLTRQTFPNAVIEQDTVEEACVSLLGGRAGWYQRHSDNGHIICAAVPRHDSEVAARAVLHGQHVFGGVCRPINVSSWTLHERSRSHS